MVQVVTGTAAGEVLGVMMVMDGTTGVSVVQTEARVVRGPLPTPGTPTITTGVPGVGQGDYDGRGQQTASPMLTAIMSGGVGISGRELLTQLINSLEQANHSLG